MITCEKCGRREAVIRVKLVDWPDEHEHRCAICADLPAVDYSAPTFQGEIGEAQCLT